MDPEERRSPNAGVVQDAAGVRQLGAEADVGLLSASTPRNIGG